MKTLSSLHLSFPIFLMYKTILDVKYETFQTRLILEDIFHYFVFL